MSQKLTPNAAASPMWLSTGCMYPRWANSSSKKRTRSLGCPGVRAMARSAHAIINRSQRA